MWGRLALVVALASGCAPQAPTVVAHKDPHGEVDRGQWLDVIRVSFTAGRRNLGAHHHGWFEGDDTKLVLDRADAWPVARFADPILRLSAGPCDPPAEPCAEDSWQCFADVTAELATGRACVEQEGTRADHVFAQGGAPTFDPIRFRWEPGHRYVTLNEGMPSVTAYRVRHEAAGTRVLEVSLEAGDEVDLSFDEHPASTFDAAADHVVDGLGPERERVRAVLQEWLGTGPAGVVFEQHTFRPAHDFLLFRIDEPLDEFPGPVARGVEAPRHRIMQVDLHYKRVAVAGTAGPDPLRPAPAVAAVTFESPMNDWRARFYREDLGPVGRCGPGEGTFDITLAEDGDPMDVRAVGRIPAEWRDCAIEQIRLGSGGWGEAGVFRVRIVYRSGE